MAFRKLCCNSFSLFLVAIRVSTSSFSSLPYQTHVNVFPTNTPLANAHSVSTHTAKAAFLLRRRSDVRTASMRRSASGAKRTAAARRAA